jgi:transcriptional regulator GlxA family with amidase domain
MDLLVRDFCQLQAEFLDRVLAHMPVGTASQASAVPLAEAPAKPSATHPQVLRALEHIQVNLSNPKLTVGRVAAAIDIHPTYLSQIFVEQVGERMSRFIASRRIDRAKTLLATTDWQIKRIALETGHANPNWFCHIFVVHAGMTPGEYRRMKGSSATHH